MIMMIIKIIGTVHEDLYIFIIISLSVLPRMRNVSVKSCRDNQNTHTLCCTTNLPEIRAFYEIMWKNIVLPGSPHTTT